MNEGLIIILQSTITKSVFVLANSAGPDEMLQFCGISSGSILFVYVPFLNIFQGTQTPLARS